jgi:hypothetical protein
VTDPAPQEQAEKKLTPPDPPMVPFVLGGMAIWLVLGLVFLSIRSTMAEHGNEGWIAICFAGVLVALPGLGLMLVHDRNRRRRHAAARDHAHE